MIVMEDDMARTGVPDGLWERIEPLLPPHPPVGRRGGRPWVSDRACLCGILFVLRSGIPWNLLPAEFGVGKMSCWRRLAAWKKAGVWQKVHELLLSELHADGRIEPRVALADSTTLRAVKGAKRPARTRPTAAKPAANTTC
jgi:transposase